MVRGMTIRAIGKSIMRDHKQILNAIFIFLFKSISSCGWKNVFQGIVFDDARPEFGTKYGDGIIIMVDDELEIEVTIRTRMRKV